MSEPAPVIVDLRREKAHQSAIAIRAAIAMPSTAGERRIVHLDMGRPRRGIWLATWPNLPGLTLDWGRRRYRHELLPGWEYTVREMVGEMLEDLDRFAETGELPREATNHDDR